MDQDATWYGGIVLGLAEIVLDGDPAPLPKNGAEPPPIFGPFFAAKGLDPSRCHLVWRLALAQVILC